MHTADFRATEPLPYTALLSASAAQRSVGSTRTVRLPTITEFLDWAERDYPALFPGHSDNQSVSTIVFRYYPQSGNYLGVSGEAVLALGPVTGNVVVSVGTLAQFADAVAASLATAYASSDAEAARFLLQAQFSAAPAEIAAIRSSSYALWLDQQLALPPGPSAWDWLQGKGYSVIDTHAYFALDYPHQFMIWYQLLVSTDAVRKRWALALSEIFVVSARGIGGIGWPAFAMAAYWDLLCTHGFGNYRELLQALTLNPAMGIFLNTRGNQKEDPASGRVPDENYAREVMQLFSIGLHQLNLDGSPRLDDSGQPIDSYSQSDVINLARVFTGYDFDNSVGSFVSPVPPGGRWLNIEVARRPLVLHPALHSSLEKSFLGVTIAADTPAAEALRIALDTLFQHPNVGPFLARQLIQRLVVSNPSPAYVARVATVFNDNGAGQRGDLKQVLRAILLDDEARAAAGLNSATFGKLREPMLRIVQWGRTFKVKSLHDTWKVALGDWDPRRDLGQYPLNPPSVFSYFRPGYVPPSTALVASKASAPEFQIVNESSVGTYINFLQSIVVDGIWVRSPELPYFPTEGSATDGPDIVPDYSAEVALVADPRALVNRLNLLLCAGQLAPATQDLIVTALALERMTTSRPEAAKRNHVARAILFVMCAADYLVQK